jgi:arylsulfatase A-like enzyme
VRVPLIVWAPGRLPPARRGDATTGLDVAPTLLALTGVAVPPSMRGRDLFGAAEPPSSLVSEGLRGTQVSIRDERWKLIRTVADVSYAPEFERRAGTVELYDLGADPGERHDVAAAESGARARLAAALDAWLAAHPATPAGVPDVTDKLEELRALGYVE